MTTGAKVQSGVDAAAARETSVRGEVKLGATVIATFARTAGPPLGIDLSVGKRRLRVVGDTVYISPTKKNALPARVAWIRYSPADLQKSTPAVREQMAVARAGLADVSDDFAILGHVAELVSQEKREDKVSLHGWGGLVSVADLLADPATRESVQPMAREFGTNTLMSLEIWLDSKNRPVSLALASGGKSFETTYTGWGATVTIPTPPAGTFVPFG